MERLSIGIAWLVVVGSIYWWVTNKNARDARVVKMTDDERKRYEAMERKNIAKARKMSLVVFFSAAVVAAVVVGIVLAYTGDTL